jgi:hypothetical protein
MVPPPEADRTLLTYCRTVLPPSERELFGFGWPENHMLAAPAAPYFL